MIYKRTILSSVIYLSGSQLIERVGISDVSFSDAVKNTLDGLKGEMHVQWFQVLEQRGKVGPDGKVQFQVIVKIAV